MNYYALTYSPSILLGLATFVICGLTALGLARLSNTKPDDSENRQQTLDGLRGLLATGVFLHHYVLTFYLHATGKWSIPSSRFYSLLGSTSVALFFMITGFLFWQKLIVREGKVNWKTLYISRVFRIVPLYWFAVGVVIFIVALVGSHQLNVPLRNLLKQISYWVTFANYPDINKYDYTYGIVAGVLWTLKYEWLFYLSLPVLALFIIVNKKIPGLLWVLTGVIIWLSYKPVYIGFLLFNTMFLIYFLVGAFAASLARNESARKIAGHPIVSLIAVASIILALTLFDIEYSFNQALLLAVFFIPIALGNSIFNILTTRAFKLLGDISYSIYILHGIMLYVLFTLLFPTVFNPQTNIFTFYAIMAGSGMTIVLISWITNHIIEKPFIKLGKKIGSFTIAKYQPSKEETYERV